VGSVATSRPSELPAFHVIEFPPGPLPAINSPTEPDPDVALVQVFPLPSLVMLAERMPPVKLAVCPCGPMLFASGEGTVQSVVPLTVIALLDDIALLFAYPSEPTLMLVTPLYVLAPLKVWGLLPCLVIDVAPPITPL